MATSPQALALRRGDVIYVHYRSSVGCEINTEQSPQGRPSVVLWTDNGKAVRVVPISDGHGFQSVIPYSVPVFAAELGSGGKDSVIACGEVQKADWSRINASKGIWCRLSPARMEAVDVGLRDALGIVEP